MGINGLTMSELGFAIEKNISTALLHFYKQTKRQTNPIVKTIQLKQIIFQNGLHYFYQLRFKHYTPKHTILKISYILGQWNIWKHYFRPEVEEIVICVKISKDKKILWRWAWVVFTKLAEHEFGLNFECSDWTLTVNPC